MTLERTIASLRNEVHFDRSNVEPQGCSVHGLLSDAQYARLTRLWQRGTIAIT